MTERERSDVLYEVECFLRTTEESNPVVALQKFRQLPTYGHNMSVIPPKEDTFDWPTSGRFAMTEDWP
jgi:hypothetical protein